MRLLPFLHLITIIEFAMIVKQTLNGVQMMKLLRIAKILFLITLLLLVSIGLISCGEDYDDDYNDDFIRGLNVVFDNPAAAGRPSPSFSADILPILTSRCAFAGCHVAGGPDGIDLRTYDAVIAGGDDDDTVIAGDAWESELVEQIVEGEMPPNGPLLPAAQIQLIIDWINEEAKNN